MTYFFMGILFGVYAAVVLYGTQYLPHKDAFFDLHDSTMLKGVFCIIVVLVHVPSMYQNLLQDAIGSFAYIGVTYFFMTSSYGLKFGVKNKDDYLKGFWKKRIPKILLPALICNAISVIINYICGENIHFLSFINIHDWVKVLLMFYILFWMIYYVPIHFGLPSGIWQDILICVIILSISITDRLTSINLTFFWNVESMGFVYGIILAECSERLVKFLNNKWLIKTVIIFTSGLIFGMAYLKYKPVIFWGDYILKIVLGFILLNLILCLIKKIHIGNRVLEFIANISYEVYLLHFSIYKFVDVCMNIENSGVYIWFSILLTLALATAIRFMNNILIKKYIGKLM